MSQHFLQRMLRLLELFLKHFFRHATFAMKIKWLSYHSQTKQAHQMKAIRQVHMSLG